MAQHSNDSARTTDAVAAYGKRAEEYVAAVGRIEHVDREDLEYVGRWADAIDGEIFDVGSGPGQWTAWLASRGSSVRGVEPALEFVELARATYPESEYLHGWAEDLPTADASLGGILAWYSLIHTPPESIEVALREFARCVRPGGSLLLGFFTADEQQQFDHAISTAYFWPIPLIVAKVEEAGFRVTNTDTREGPRPGRVHGALIATRRGKSDS